MFKENSFFEQNFIVNMMPLVLLVIFRSFKILIRSEGGILKNVGMLLSKVVEDAFR